VTNDKSPTIPINALFAADDINPNPEWDPRPVVYSADLIFGVDVMSRKQFLVYGQHTLRRIMETGESERCRVLRIELDRETEELARLCAVIQVVKGRHDYQGSPNARAG
jgi:hypothetical protein